MTDDQESTVLLTDRAWPDDSIERGVLEDAGFRLVTGPSDPAPAATIEALVAEHQPAAILTCWAPVSAAAIANTAPLRVVARMGVGLDNIAVSAATERGVLVRPNRPAPAPRAPAPPAPAPIQDQAPAPRRRLHARAAGSPPSSARWACHSWACLRASIQLSLIYGRCSSVTPAMARQVSAART